MKAIPNSSRARRSFPGMCVGLTNVSRTVAFGACVLLSASFASAAQNFPEDDVAEFTDRHCSSCHNDVDKEGGLDLTSLKFNPGDADNFTTWVKIHDRVRDGEMQP